MEEAIITAETEVTKPRPRQRGEGSFYKPKYRDKKTGELREVRFFWIQYYRNGSPIRENTHSDKKSVAEAILRKRLGELASGNWVNPKVEKIRYAELRDALLSDYEVNHRKSLFRRKDGTLLICGIPALDEFFKDSRATEVTTDRMREFIRKRQEEGAPNSTINRSLGLLRRMFNLAIQDGKMRTAPYMPMLKEPPARKGFLEYEDFRRLRQALPEHLRPVLTLAFYSGMRLAEILGLHWENVSLLNAQIRLDPGATKNDEARVIPLPGEIIEMLRLERQRRDAHWPTCAFVFTQDGRPIGTFRKAWIRACRQAGLGQFVCAHCSEVVADGRCCRQCAQEKRPSKLKYSGLIFHDLRRAGVRHLVRAGVPERVAMAISGHKTRTVFERYNIVSERDLSDAAKKLEGYIGVKAATWAELGSSEANEGKLEQTRTN